MSKATRLKWSWPVCPDCKRGSLAYSYHADIRKGIEYCQKCDYTKRAQWIEKAVMDGLKRRD